MIPVDMKAAPPAMAPESSPPADMIGRSPLGQLLHALNQPLTGLQCAMEVALAGSRTVEQYRQGLREGLELTERMRALVEAIREVTEEDDAGEKRSVRETTELKTLLSEIVDELAPVAEAKNVSLALIGSSAPSLAVSLGRRELTGLVFRFLESVLSLAASGTVMRIDTEFDLSECAVELRTRWQGEEAAFSASRRDPFSRAELGLLVAQGRWERSGVHWERAREGMLETVTVRLPRMSAGGKS